MTPTNQKTNKPTKTLLLLTTLITLLALIAAGFGVQPAADAESYPFTSLRGETVEKARSPFRSSLKMAIPAPITIVIRPVVATM